MASPERVVDEATVPLTQQRPFQLGVVAALATFAFALYGRSAAPDPAATPLVASDGRTFYVLALIATLGLGAVLYVRRDLLESQASGWILPTLTLMGALLVAGVYHRWPVIIAVSLLAGSGVFVSLLVDEFLTADDDAARSSARLTRWILTLGVVLVVFSMVTLHRAGHAFSAIGIGVTGALAMYQLLDGAQPSHVRRAVYAGAVAIGLVELSWPLDYWHFTGWYGGALVASVFLFFAQLVGAHVRLELSRPFVIRHAGASAVLFMACAYLAAR